MTAKLLLLALAAAVACVTTHAPSALPRPPVTEWIELEPDKTGPAREALADLAAAEGIDSEAAATWIASLQEALPGGRWRLTLGLAPAPRVVAAGFRPFLTWRTTDPRVLTQVCLLSPTCLACADAAIPTGQEAPAAPRQFRNVCSTLSTAYSLVYVLGVRTEEGDLGTTDMRDGVRVWKRGFLETIATDQGHTPDGTPRDKIKKAYERYDCECTEETAPTDAGGVDAWLRDLETRTESDPPEDCHFIVEGADWAHDMHVDGVEEVDGRKVLNVVDTGRQGTGIGSDIPVHSVGADEKWEVTEPAGGPQVRCLEPADNATFWNGKNPTGASFICCKCPEGE